MRIVLAGAESGFFHILEKFQAPSVLMTYYYLRKKSDEEVEALLARAKRAKMWMLLDSGAHTFLVKYPWLDPRKGTQVATDTKMREAKDAFDASGRTVEDVKVEADEYVRAYIEWVKKFKQYFDVVAELDIDAVVGMDKVYEWRSWWDQAGIQIMPTMHTSQPQHVIQEYRELGREEDAQHYAHWEAMLNGEFGYVGMESGWDLPTMNEFFTGGHFGPLIRKYKIRIHGWAMTNLDAIRKLPFFSVDSTSWLSGGKFGTTFVYQGMGRMRMHDKTMKEAIRPKFREYCKSMSIDYDAFIADKYEAVHEFNASQWVKFSQDEVNRFADAYWLSPEERTAAIAAGDTGRLTNSIVRHTEELTSASKDLRRPSEIPRYCNTCYIQDKCPAYAVDSTCSLMGQISIRSSKELRDAVFTILEIGADRALNAAMIERIRGGYPDANVSKELNSFLGLVGRVKDIFDTRDELVIKAKGEGILGKIFGGLIGGAAGTQKRSSQEHEVSRGGVMDARVMDVEVLDEE